jgi:hypothetical protein
MFLSTMTMAFSLLPLLVLLHLLFTKTNHFFNNLVGSLVHCENVLVNVRACIQWGNFNWNKIHNFDIGGFCKKSRNRSIFVFPCPHFGLYSFCISALRSSQPPLTFFFKRNGISSDTSFERPICKEYLFPEYFQSLHAKKINPIL